MTRHAVLPLAKGEATIQLMNALGFQFLALGNHDFDGAEPMHIERLP